jgi:L-asparaginase
MSQDKLPRICLIYTGGTIGMIHENGVLRPPKDPGSFLRFAPELSNLAVIDFVLLLNKDSTNMTPQDWTTMANAIYERMGPEHDYKGFVIVHGTDTMHFSASALAFAFGPNLNKPVVFTGSQTHQAVLHGDARTNLVRAVMVALQPIAEVVIAFGDFVYRGCRTQKCDERKFQAFESPAFYPIADITETILLHSIAVRTAPPANRPSAGQLDFQPDFQSDIIQLSLFPGLKPEALKPLLDPKHCEAVVLQSFGMGNVPDFQEYSFQAFIHEALRKNIAVVITSQFPANSTLGTCYEPGIKAVEAGAIPTGNMTHAAATVKLRWGLARVRKAINANKLTPEKKLCRIKYLMGIPYVGEMDAPRKATPKPRNAKTWTQI